MSDKTPVLKVHMLGGFSLSYDGKPISLRKNTTTKAMKLLQILLYTKETGIARTDLLEALYGREDLADMSNNLRVTSHRLKKILVESGFPEYDYILIRHGIYYWKSSMEIQVDALEFDGILKQAEQEQEQEERMKLLENACAMYKGEFLPGLSGEDWVLLASVQYKKKYTEALLELCKYKKQQREYEKILELCNQAVEIYPFDEWQAIKIDSLMVMNRYKEALEVYEDTAKLYFEELGISPSERMMDQFKDMSEKMSYKPRVLSEIKGGLKEEEGRDGAFYCSLPSFRDSYRLVSRIIERNGQSVYLMLVSITDGNGHPMENKNRLSALSEELYYTIMHSLRRGDSFTKYSPSQFLILLVGTSKENCRIIFDRIAKHYSREHKTWSQYLEYYVSSIADVEKQNSKISFKEDKFQWDRNQADVTE
ncbi:MAG: BTAD domain-containing putative transcriptional regulator [Blautia sp.]